MTNEEMFKKVEKRFNSQDFLSFVGMKLEHIEKGKVIISCENKKEFSQYLGYMHGGMVAALADTAGGHAAASILEEGYKTVTSELKIHYLKPVVAKKVIAVGEVLSAGKKLIIVEAVIKDEEDNMLAKMIATMFVIDPA
ncbi:PaaI family thioesterase [Brachyspira sp. G79]|uniref:PaaI family thioesterase n=1 Tax=Brachyspira sp. G79 TaxID=1358104 RepID=UPI000BBC1B5D|nr:PaaI family thioesterase [Brachyspira sp. G79]PCG19542.1 thioesterase [Brachyspira sp. G79]